MTKSNGEEPKTGGRMERFQQGVRKRTLLAKKKVQNITKEDVKSYVFRNAFVLLTITAVIVAFQSATSMASVFKSTWDSNPKPSYMAPASYSSALTPGPLQLA
ncbi:Excitatory amino acid transporter 1 [Tupaia chinensis]|uniref:Excitatory amino acid transporter 1 n=1 Tax=Tupaia chinensis TaxID=246437 RepID=L9JSI1_TUPCH|nr:Excitatory amino acid transporter 1 [Tupaia chinensis]